MNETDKNLASKKAIANYTKQIEGIQYLIKIDQQNFNDEKEKHIRAIWCCMMSGGKRWCMTRR